MVTYSKLRKVISGGQTGADRTGLECAAAIGLLTGGWVPNGWRTQDGPDPTLASFGCIEHPSSAYPPRTFANAQEAEATIWFGDATSPGGKLTRRYCLELGKPFIQNPTDLRPIAAKYSVLNVAGNRANTNPQVIQLVHNAFSTLATHNHERD